MSKRLILNYHKIVEDRVSKAENELGTISMDQFKRQMIALKDSNCEVVSVFDLVTRKKCKQVLIALTFDEGFDSDYYIVYPILKQLNFIATFFISLSNVPENSNRWRQYQEMSDFGFQIGCNGRSKIDMSCMRWHEQSQELSEVKRVIERNISAKVRYFSLPGGKYNITTLECAKDVHYAGVLSNNFAFVNHEDAPFVLGRWKISSKLEVEHFKYVIGQDQMLELDSESIL